MRIHKWNFPYGLSLLENRLLHHHSWRALPANLDFNCRACLGEFCRDVAHADAEVERRALGAADDFADFRGHRTRNWRDAQRTRFAPYRVFTVTVPISIVASAEPALVSGTTISWRTEPSGGPLLPGEFRSTTVLENIAVRSKVPGGTSSMVNDPSDSVFSE